MLDLQTMVFRDYSSPGATVVPTIVDAPYAGHSALIADYHKVQSLIETLLASGVGRVYLTDWKSATEDMKDLEIDQYLAEHNVCVDDLGGRVNLIGLCQGGWMSAMYAARFPHRVASLALASSLIDTDAGEGPVKRMAHEYPVSFYEELVALGEGLNARRNDARRLEEPHPEEHHIEQHID
jgi:poly(3-hydroxyalkanoate) synthetase